MKLRDVFATPKCFQGAAAASLYKECQTIAFCPVSCFFFQSRTTTQQDVSSAYCHQKPCICNMQAHQKEDGHYHSNSTLCCIQRDRHKGQHEMKGVTVASEGKSLLMTHTTQDTML